MLKENKYSVYAIAFIFAFIFSASFYFDLWKKNRITLDAPSYYTYLPATFIYKDLHLNFIDKDKAFFKDKIWYYTIEDGKKLIKHPMGISVALSPFFLVAHIVAKVNGAVQDGYSLTYQNVLSLGVLLYLFLGLFYLRKFLLYFFSDTVTAFTLLAIGLGTNLLWYSTFEGLMPHAISFSFWSMCIYVFYKWITSAQKKYLVAFAVTFAMIVLIRPLSILGISYFLLYAIIAKGGLKPFFVFLKVQLKPLGAAVLIAVLIASPQLMYWKYATGSWLYDVYRDEHFVFSSPQILPFLFSFRKGVFVYTPVLMFAAFGMVLLLKKYKAFFVAIFISLAIAIYVLSSWWAWSYGICWGMRPMIDYYAMLAFPLALCFEQFLNRKIVVRSVFTGLIFLLISFSLFQTWQYKNGLIHYDDMTREAYFKGLFQTKTSIEWQDLLKPYDWDRRMKGLPQVEYSRSYFEESYKNQMVALRAFNMQYMGINPKAQNAVAAYAKSVVALANVGIKPLVNGHVFIVAANGKYVAPSAENNNVLLANTEMPGINEEFDIVYLQEGDNRIALKSVANGKYVSVSAIFPNLLFASSNVIAQKETFRLFVTEPITNISAGE